MNLIEQLGGVKEIARALGVRHGAVGNWRRRGWPDAAKWKLLLLARERGIAITPEDMERSIEQCGVSTREPANASQPQP